MENQSISLWDRFKVCVSEKYCCFEGRATRSEYWGFYLFYVIFYLAACLLGAVLSGGDSDGILARLPLFLFVCALILPTLGAFVRRMHDTNRSGWNYFWCLLPFIGWIILLVFLCQDSQRGSNKYGPSEKYPDGDAA